jgi:hypothetical protein
MKITTMIATMNPSANLPMQSSENLALVSRSVGLRP